MAETTTADEPEEWYVTYLDHVGVGDSGAHYSSEAAAIAEATAEYQAPNMRWAKTATVTSTKNADVKLVWKRP